MSYKFGHVPPLQQLPASEHDLAEGQVAFDFEIILLGTLMSFSKSRDSHFGQAMVF
ncbi:MAG TPA: hypothetical protein VJC18_03135 [bacterium]|nr:hypothetical protein [bacterium]